MAFIIPNPESNQLNESYDLTNIYVDRLTTAWASIDEDIRRWRRLLKAQDSAIAHHVREFDQFRREAYSVLMEQTAQSLAVATPVENKPKSRSRYQSKAMGQPAIATDLEFRALVIGLLSARWALLRQIAIQRAKGSPYFKGLQELDALARRYYHRVRLSLPASLHTTVKPFAPLVYLGSLNSLTIYNRNVPLVLTVPYGAIDQKSDPEYKSRLAIAHEIGHAILLQLPAIGQELRERLPAVLQTLSTQPAKRQRLLQEALFSWLDEILADMLGCALAGDHFFFSAIWTMATSEENTGVGDREHPPALVRPFVHMFTLDFLDKREGKESRAAATADIHKAVLSSKELRQLYLTQLVGGRLGRQFKTMPAVTFLTLEDIRAEMELVIGAILTHAQLRLTALADQTFGDLLLTCAANTSTGVEDTLEPWGAIPTTDRNQFALDISGDLGPDFQTPMADFHNEDLCGMPLLSWLC